MSKIAIVYWSGTGNTEAMANLVMEGIKSAGEEADLFMAGDFSVDQAKKYPKIALGCPAMGSEQLEETEFEPMYESIKPELGGKAVVLFGSYSWAEGEWMTIWREDCEGTGCRLIAEPVIVYEAPEGESAEKCRKLGKALAQV